jgi:hypothetical protein
VPFALNILLVGYPGYSHTTMLRFVLGYCGRLFLFTNLRHIAVIGFFAIGETTWGQVL